MTAPAVDSLFLAFQEAVAGRYSLERELGRGGMGVVYLAREVRLDRSVAIKLLPPELAAQQTLRDRFLREARTAARLSHPYIAPIHSVDEVGDFVFYVMAFVDGETLAQRLTAHGPRPAQEVTRILREAAWALAYAHAQGVVHRDIKPANIMIERGTDRTVVLDFGIARHAAGGETVVGEVLGTPEYMSPEQAAGEDLDGRSDLYALGIVGFAALTGTLPFSAPTAQGVLLQHLTKPAPAVGSLARGVPPALARVIDRCLEKDRTARFPTGEALAEALAPSLEKRADLPVPLRVFLDRRRVVTLLIPFFVSFGPAVGLFESTARHGWSLVRMGAGVGLLAAGIGLPIVLLTMRMRSVLRLGYGADDIAAALRTKFERIREEFLYEFGPKESKRERLFRVGGALGLLGGAALLAGSVISHHRALIPISFISGYFGLLGTIISSKWRRMRTGADSLFARFWQGKPGALLMGAASIKLGQRAIAQDRATELAIAMSAEALYDMFPKETRQMLGNVPEVLHGLESHARVVRARIVELDASLAEAQRTLGGAHTASNDRQDALVADLRAARVQAETRLAEVVTALENLRLDLLRLRAGAGTTEGVTRDIAAARALGQDADRLIAGSRDVAQLLGEA